ncbi:MAG: hypothetical protein HKM24_01765 [Gammaproteobacteria bacterium]|nr:hypothetical protein [Gammaproteobacteria bacterium]
MTDVYVLEVGHADLEPILRARPAITEELGRLMAERTVQNELRSQNGQIENLPDDFRTRARQFAKRISQFFGINA